jgi:hypothetical protein
MRPFLLPAKDPQAVITIPFEFGPLLVESADPNAVVSSASVTASVFAGGPDPSPSAILALAPDLSQAPVVMQRITGGLNGTTYLLVALATIESTGEVIPMKALLPVSV